MTDVHGTNPGVRNEVEKAGARKRMRLEHLFHEAARGSEVLAVVTPKSLPPRNPTPFLLSGPCLSGATCDCQGNRTLGSRHLPHRSSHSHLMLSPSDHSGDREETPQHPESPLGTVLSWSLMSHAIKAGLPDCRGIVGRCNSI